MQPIYSLYLLLCKGDVIYTGVTNNVPKRIKMHFDGNGAKFTKSRPPIRLLTHVEVGTRSEAQKLEYEVKQLARKSKISFVEKYRALNRHEFPTTCLEG
jgi:putative endonuclease